MSAINEGMHLGRQARDLQEHMRDGIITGVVDSSPSQGGAVAAQLPKRFTAYSARDDIVQMKQQLMDPKTGLSPFGRVYASDDDFKWLQKKEAAAEAVNYDGWFNANFNKNDLASRQFAQEINPGFYADRERELMERADTVLRLKKIQLRGPQSKEDLHMLFLLNSGRVALPDDWDRLGADWTAGKPNAKELNQKQFQGGLIRMPLFTTQAQRNATAKAAIAPTRRQPFAVDPPPQGFFGWGDDPVNTRMARPVDAAGRPQNTFSHQVISDLQNQ